MKSLKENSNGFTIIELLIATVALSILLVIITAAVFYISKTYIKGQVIDNTQNTARSIISDLSTDFEYTPNADIVAPANGQINVYTSSSHTGPGTPMYYFCAGQDVYAYQRDVEITSSSTLGLIKFLDTNCPAASATITLPGQYQELLSHNERLGQLSITQGTSASAGIPAYTVAVTVDYGSNQVLNRTTPSSASNPANEGVNYQCSSGISFATGFCAISTLTTTVIPRINE